MYFGSVRFFKHLILTVLALLIIVPTAGCIYFGTSYYNLRSAIAETADIPTLPEGDGGTLTAYASDSLEPEKAAPLSYQTKYPELYVDNDFQYIEAPSRTIYLTFDDGPSNLTSEVLDILKEYDAHATFFVVYKEGEQNEALYKRIVGDGHTLAIHTASHQYKQIYQSVDAYLDDFALLSDKLEEVTGQKPEIFRFPGGSINNYNKGIHQELAAEMLRRGYTYYDWDVSSGSSTKTANAGGIYANVVNGVSGKDSAIVLLHDAGTYATVTALPDILRSLTEAGYHFDPLTKNIRPSCFDYSN